MKDLKNKKKKKPINRFHVMLGIMFFIFFVIFARLIYLQVFKYAEYSDRANTRSRRFLAEKAPRGKIYDAEGNLLATNVQTYTVTFTETDEANKDFFYTMAKVFKILDENGEKQVDNFKLKINDDKKPYFDFGTSNPEVIKAQEIRFKRDRGLNDFIRKKLFPRKNGDLTDEEESKINEKLLAITPTETFDYLIKEYKLYGLLNPTKEEEDQYKKTSPKEIAEKLEKKYSLNTIRRYMVVKDAMKMQSFSGFKPVTIASNVNKDTAFIFLQKLNDLPGINVNLEPMRYYPYHDLASSVIGYVSSINPDKKSRYEERGYDVSTDLIGMAGIESSFENILKGTKGGTTIKVNSAGRKIDELFKLEPSPGENIHLSIDKNIEYSAEQMLKHQLEWLQTRPDKVNTKNATRGAAVAIEVKTGKVLAMVSYPTFDPNVFSTPGALTPEIMNKYFNTNLEKFGEEYIKRLGLQKNVDDLFPKDKNGNREDKYDIVPKPMYNYATMGLTPPGSTFKPMTAVAALQDDIITPNETIPERMYFNEHPDVFGKAFAPADNADHGANIDVRKAIAVSCNHFFYECAYRMYMKNGKDIKSLNSIADFAWQAGLGVNPNSKQKATTGLEISENFGQVYNFQSFKNQTVYYSKYELVSQLKDGSMGSYSFPSMDIGYNEDDSDALKKAKSDIKDLIANRLKEVGTDKFEEDYSNFKRDIKFKIEDFTKVSSSYKDSISKYEASGKKYSINTIVATIEQFILNKKAEMTSPAQLVYSAIGQGINAFTPVQLASYISTVVNGGTRYRVHLVDKITNSEGKVVDEFKPEVMNKINIKPQNVEVIKQGMQMTNMSGTGSSVFRNFPISTGGKTGTATFQKGQENFGRAAFGVYVSFAPVEDPKVAVAVILYDGAHGYFGAPVARAIYETYFRDELKKNYPGYTPTFMNGGTYDYSLNPPLQDIKDDGIHKSEAEQKVQQQQQKEKEEKIEIRKEELKKRER